jgi:hypothetical protein
LRDDYSDAEGQCVQPPRYWRHDEVHRVKGPGLIEEIYKKCLGRECEFRNISYVKELRAFLEYKGLVFEEPEIRRSFYSSAGFESGQCAFS